LLLGLAAVPLFAFARLYVSASAACVIALVYLLSPGVHGTNLYEFHYLPLSTFFLWLALYALEARRDLLAAVAVVLTLTLPEDGAIALMVWGAYLLVSGKRPRAGLVVGAVAGVYVLLLTTAILPPFLGSENVSAMYQKLMPNGETGVTSLLKTVVGNPWYTAGTLLEEPKLVFVLQMFVPLALAPLRRRITLLFALPGIFFTLLATGYSPMLSIHYQYTAYWTTYLLVATVLVLASLNRGGRRSALFAIALATLACSYQYGAVMQHNTSAGGPVAYKFGVDHEGRARREALDVVLTSLPPRAKVSCSAFTTPQVSNRPDAYSMTLGLYDAEYMLFPTVRADFVGGEYDAVLSSLEKRTFGVVAVSRPFALARRGQDPSKNDEVLSMIH
jgi:uncharacterized membrane protein